MYGIQCGDGLRCTCRNSLVCDCYAVHLTAMVSFEPRCLCIVAGMFTDNHYSFAGVFCAFGAGGIVLGLILLEHSARIKVPASLVFLGGASYSIYLVHFSAITLFAVVLSHFHAPLNNLVFAAATTIGLAAGVLFDRIVDQPIQRAAPEAAQACANTSCMKS